MVTDLNATEQINTVQYRYFTSDDFYTSRTNTVTVKGKLGYPELPFRENMVFKIPEKTTAFNMVANFDDCASGHYSIRWRIKLLDNFTVAKGFHFTANVAYDAEADINGTLDVFMLESKLKVLAINQRYDLVLEETLIVQPHTGSAHVQVVLCNMDNETQGCNSGFIIERVEIRPMSLVLRHEENDVSKFVLNKSTIPFHVIQPMEYQRSAEDAPESTPITRLVSSKSSHFLASLALSRDIAHITVWNMDAENGPNGRAVAIIRLKGISDIPVGLAISANGDQIAVYQEPNIGQWAEGTDIEPAKLPFTLFHNPLVRSPEFAVKLNESGTPQGPNSVPRLEEFKWEPNPLKEFIGYGGFLPGPQASSRGKGESNGISTRGNSESTNARVDTTPLNSIFVACNGLYLDVFEISAERKWTQMHSIGLADLTPTISRRLTCKMMMESISNNTFMWLEDDGICCTVWDLHRGTNISYISADENGFMGRETRYSKMAMSPSESIVALATTNGTLTTYFANSGASIDNRTFPGFKIEHIGFHGQDSQLFVVLRNSESAVLSARILDSLELRSEIAVNQVPIPTIGSTILAFFNTSGFHGKGLICEAFESKINCYISYQPTSSKIDKSNENVYEASPEDSVSESLLYDNLQYRIQVDYHREHLPEGLHARYWIHHIKVLEEDIPSKSAKPIFSFVPEPWMRSLTTKAVDPSKLMSAYYLPDGTRFAVVGMQTLQIWMLPTGHDHKCNLQFIWSKPKDEESLKKIHPNKRERAGEYYYDILKTTIHMDVGTGNTVAEIIVDDDKRRVEIVSIPGPEYKGDDTWASGTIGSRYAIEHCFRSIHLLAAAYDYSKSESNKALTSRKNPAFTFDCHAEAIIQFTSVHLNRQLPASVVLLEPRSHPQDSSKSNEGFMHSIMHKKPGLSVTQYGASVGKQCGVVTLLTTLLDQKYLHKTNHDFIMGLLVAEDGFWIPSDDGQLNPIKRAIDLGNRALIEAFIKYAIKYARVRHPAYLMPVVQCLEELTDQHPDLVAYMFKMTSYVPAHNHGYLSAHIMVANPRYKTLLKSILKLFSRTKVEKSNNLDDYHRPVFSLRSQLPLRTAFNIHDVETYITKKQIFRFPEAVDEETKQSQSKFTHKVYVCPYPKLSTYGPNKPWYTGSRSGKSPFTVIAGGDFFEYPAMQATLRFKWQKYATLYWFIRFFFVLMFVIFMVGVTTAQVTVSTIPTPLQLVDPNMDWSDQIGKRYLKNWRWVFYTALANAFILLAYEFVQFMDGPKKYFRSPYNYMELTTYFLNVAGCAIFLSQKPGSDPQGPNQIVPLSFGILAIYLNLLFELRVLKPLGIVVNIILNIARGIVWFFMVLTLFLVSFTLALQHLLHTRQYRQNCLTEDRKGCGPPDYPGDYPENFFEALTDTYFFLAGRYDPVSKSLDFGSPSFRIMMLMFFMFTAILLLNILIALMNDGFELSKKQGEVAWHKQLSEVIAEVERFLMPKKYHKKSDYFPSYIYYYASAQEAENYVSGHKISNKSKLSPEGKYLVDNMNEIYTNVSGEQHAQSKKLDALKAKNLKLEEALEAQDIKLLSALMDLNYIANIVDGTGNAPAEAASRPDPANESMQPSRSTTFESDHQSASPPHNATPEGATPVGGMIASVTRIETEPTSTSIARRPTTTLSPRRQNAMDSAPLTTVNQDPGPASTSITRRPTAGRGHRRKYSMESAPLSFES
ncbi:WD repeat-containing protein 38 [Mortierella sp. AD094]|nr:WD repeat-containing protein 38 [Mortierella sp. AD094]